MIKIKPTIVILHCSATPDFKPGDVAFDRFGVAEVDLWHKERGFQGVGYHFIIKRSGIIQTGRWCVRDEVEMGAHCAHENNRSIGVCYIGMHSPTPEQIESIRALSEQIDSMFGIAQDNWYPHNYFNKFKTCPGFDKNALLKILTGD